MTQHLINILSGGNITRFLVLQVFQVSLYKSYSFHLELFCLFFKLKMPFSKVKRKYQESGLGDHVLNCGACEVLAFRLTSETLSCLIFFLI